MTTRINETTTRSLNDKLIDFRRVNELTASKCKTSHAARELARRGLIKSVRLNERVVRYSEASVLALIQGDGGGVVMQSPRRHHIAEIRAKMLAAKGGAK